MTLSKFYLAVLNAIVIGGISFFSQLVAYGYPPSFEAVYSSGISAMLVFLITVREVIKKALQSREKKEKNKKGDNIIGMVI